MPNFTGPEGSTVTVTNGIATITGTNTVFASYRAGYRITLPSGLSVVFESDPTSDTSATISVAFSGSTETDVSYTVTPRENGSQVALETRILNQMARSNSVSGVTASWKFSPSTTDADPGDGYFRMNNATPASVTEIYISDSYFSESDNDVGAWLDTFTNGQIIFRGAERPGSELIYSVSAVTDETDYRKLVVSHISGTTTFSSDEGAIVGNALAGATGPGGDDAYLYIAYASDASGTDFTTTFDATLNYIAHLSTDTEIVSPDASDFTGLWKQYKGAPVGNQLTFDDTTSEGNPGAGAFRANNATFGSITKLWINDADANGVNIETLIQTFDDSTNASARGYLTYQGALDTSVLMIFAVVGANTDKTGFWEVTVSPISGALPANDDLMVFGFSQSGSDGAGTGDFVGPGSSSDGAPVVFDGATGKLAKVGAFASQPEAEAGNDTGKFMNPLSTSQAIAALAYDPDKASMALNIADLNGSKYSMSDGFADPFDDEGGIDTDNCLNQTYDSSSDAYSFSESEVTLAGTITGGSTNYGNFTYLNRSTVIPVDTEIIKIGVYCTSSQVVSIRLAKENSSTNYDIVYATSYVHPGGGWSDLVLPSSYTTASTGTFRLGCHINASTDLATGIDRAYITSNPGVQTGLSGWSTDSGSTMPPMRYAYTEAFDGFIVSTSITATSDPDIARFAVRLVENEAITINSDVVGWASKAEGDFTTDFASDANEIADTAHGLANDDRVALLSSDTLPAGLSLGVVYFVVNAATDTFELSLTSGGGAVTLTDDGTGTHTWISLTEATLVYKSTNGGAKLYEDPNISLVDQQTGTTMRCALSVFSKDVDVSGWVSQWS